MYYVDISIADRYPKPEAPLVVTTETDKPFRTRVGIYETDSFYDAQQNRRVEGAGEPTLLAEFLVAGSGRKFTKVELVSMPHRPPARGFFEDSWDDFRFFHELNSDEVFAHRCKDSECHMDAARRGIVKPSQLRCASADDMRGKIVAVAPANADHADDNSNETQRRAIAFTGTKDRDLRAYLELIDDETLVGSWYSVAGLAEAAYDLAREQAAKDPRKALFLVRGRPYAEQPPGLAIPLMFDGLADVHELWISEDELVQEFTSSQHDYTRHTADAFLLEIGLEYMRKAYIRPGQEDPSKTEVAQTYERHYAEYPIQYDRKARDGLIQYIVANRGWLVGARLGPANKGQLTDEDMLALGAALTPGQPRWWEEPAFSEVYRKALERGVADRKLVRESLFTRFALAGFVPGIGLEPSFAGNPFRNHDRLAAYEFDEYCSPQYRHFVANDVFVEICQHAPDHPQFPGRYWHLEDGRHISYGRPPDGLGEFDSFAEGIVVPEGCRVRRKFWHEDWLEGWLGPGRHRLRAEGDRGILVIEVVWDEPDAVRRPAADYRLAAYRRGRQLRRIADLAAFSALDKPPGMLLLKSRIVGIESADTEAFYAQAHEAARYERECFMVKTFCQFGLDQNSDNPFDSQDTAKHHREFERFKEVVGHKHYAVAAREGAALWQVRDDGHLNGVRDFQDALAKAPKPRFPKLTSYDTSDTGKAMEEVGIFFDTSTPIESIDWPNTRAERWSAVFAAQRPLVAKMTRLAPPEFIERQAHAGNVEEKIASEIYQQGWRNGWEQAFNRHIDNFFARQGTQEIMVTALTEYVTWLLHKKDKSGYLFEEGGWVDFEDFPEPDILASVRDPAAYAYNQGSDEDSSAPVWSDYGQPFNHIHNHAETTAFLALRKAAMQNCIPARLLDVVIREAVHRQGPQIAHELTSWAPLLHSVFISPFELAKLLVLSTWDAVVNFNGYWFDRAFEGEAYAYLDKCKKWSKYCLFHNIPPDGSWWSVWAFATFAVADAVFTVGAAFTGAGLLRLAGRHVGKLGFAAFLGVMVRGGISLMTHSGYRMLKMGLAVGSITGVTEELVEAYLQDRDVSALGLVARTLRNTAMFCAFSCVGEVLGKSALGDVFAHTAVLPLSSGLVAGTMRLTDAGIGRDGEQAKRVLLEMLVLCSDMLILSGIPGVGRALVGGLVARRNRKRAPHLDRPEIPETAEVVKTEQPEYRPKTKEVVKEAPKPIDKPVVTIPKARINFVELDVVPMTKSLSSADIQAIERHPVFQKLRRHHGKGEKLVILLQRLSDRGVKHEDWGEQVQSRFIERVLRHILPDAEIQPGMRGDDKGQSMLAVDVVKEVEQYASEVNKRTLVIDVADSAEMRVVNSIDNPSVDYVEMGPLKAANNLADVPSEHRLTVRKALNIGSEDRVLSVYHARRYATDMKATTGAAWNVVRAALKLRDGRKLRVIVSAAYGSTLSPDARKVYARQLKGAKFFNASEITDVTDLGDVAVIFNDTRGRMTHVHAAADITLVQGPVNPFEGLRAHTPTIHLLEKPVEPSNPETLDGADSPEILGDSSKTGEHYDVYTLDFYQAAGESSGAYRQVRGSANESVLRKALAELLGKTPKPFSHEPIYSMKPDGTPASYNGRTPYQVFLNNLEYFMDQNYR